MVLAINITMNTLEVMTVERRGHEDLQVTRTGLQPFSISPESPGFQLLVRCLLTPKTDLGFVMTSSSRDLPIKAAPAGCFQRQWLQLQMLS